MPSLEDLAMCPEHGWLSHVFLHEAAHAVAAIDRDITFNHVTISTPAEWTRDHPDGIALGGVHLDPPPSTWVEADPRKAFEFVIAGSFAEDAVFKHHLENGWLGDLRVFRQGAGLFDAFDITELDEVLGASSNEVLRSVRKYVKVEYPRIRSVVEALSGKAAGPEKSTLDYSAGPWSLTHDEVVAVLS